MMSESRRMVTGFFTGHEEWWEWGHLFLAVNDDELADNAGEFGVSIQLQPIQRRR